ncbi:MAG: YheC/YheD family protein [Cyanobacteria bacterium P01_G01_bin.54]
MKLLAICDPSTYKRRPLDVPTFYLQLAQDQRTDFFHIPTPNVLQTPADSPYIQVASANELLSYEEFLSLHEQVNIPLSLTELDLVFCRTLKPFPPGYLKQLQNWEKYVKFVNSPTGIEQQIEPNFLVKVAADYIPATIVTAEAAIAQTFFEQHQTIVAKQGNSCGGRGVFKIEYRDRAFWLDHFSQGWQSFPDFVAVMQHLQRTPGEDIIFMEYLSRVWAGDKRVVVVDGEIYGAYLRQSSTGHWVNNVSAGGNATLAQVDRAEREAIAATVDHYRRLGLHTLGYDFLQDSAGNWRISEINAGNIGGFAWLELLTGKPVMMRLFDWFRDFAQRPQAAALAASLLLKAS